MLNYFLKNQFLFILFFFSLLFMFRKITNLNTTYDLLSVLILNIVVLSLLLVNINLENYLGFFLLTEINVIFIISTVLIKEFFQFKQTKSLKTLVIFFTTTTLAGTHEFYFFNFYKKTNVNNDFFKNFYCLNFYENLLSFFIYVIVLNSFCVLFFKIKTNNVNFSFLNKNFSFFKNNIVLSEVNNKVCFVKKINV